MPADPHADPNPAPTAAPPSDPLVRIEDVHKAFGPLIVLDGVSLDFARGQTTVILGPSGTGKSVLLKHIVGLLQPDRGAIYFENQNVADLSETGLVEIRKRMGFLFQMGALFDSMTVGGNVEFPLREHTDLPRNKRRARVDRALQIVGLAGTAGKMPGELSGGQKKRVALARAIVLEPALVLYDEPTTGLDPIRSDVINELILTLSRELGITSIVVTHDMVSANKIADRMVLLHRGSILADGDPEHFAESADERVQRFIHGQAELEDMDAIHSAFAA